MEGVWEWSSTGKQFSIFDWTPGNLSNGGNQDCLKIWRLFGYHWDDAGCSEHNYYICEAR